MSIPWRNLIAFLAGLACVVIGFGIVIATRPIADDLVGWGFIAAGAGLIALAVPL